MSSTAFPKILHVGEKAIAELFDGEVEVTEKLDGCIVPETPILMSDLTYKPASSLKVGDSIVGFDEVMSGSKIRESFVTYAGTKMKECVRINFSDGRHITVTRDHPLVVRYPHKTPNGLSKRYVNAEDLRPGQRVVDFGYWEHEKTYESGYLAGQFDGEGSLVGKDLITGAQWGHLTYYQNEGKGADIVAAILKDRGFAIGRSKRQRNPKWGVAESIRVNGGWTEWLRFLGMFRPQRLLNGFADKILWGSGFNGIGDNEILSIEEVGVKKIVLLSTSTHTYVANGFCSHNSQLGFGVINGELVVRSKGKEQDLDDPDKMFRLAVQYLKSIFTEGLLTEGVFYYGEYLEKPRHSTLAYDRVPLNNIALFGVMMGNEFKNYEFIKREAARLSVDAVPLIYKGKSSGEHVLELVKGMSYLGGAQREGVVVKAYRDWEYLGRLHYTVMSGKYVTEEFKEVHNKDWKKNNTGKGKLEVMKAQYKTVARWQKAVNHLRENGKLEGTPKDIGALMKEVRDDVVLEEKENIKDQLWSLFGDDFLREASNGLPQWYKEELTKGNINEG